jgi:hypothetical protein
MASPCTFTPPTVDEAPASTGRLLFRYKLRRGITVIQNQDLTFTQGRYFSNDELLAARAVYLGGHVYELSANEETALRNAGYGSNITCPGYGFGPYGSGPYGGS